MTQFDLWTQSYKLTFTLEDGTWYEYDTLRKAKHPICENTVRFYFGQSLALTVPNITKNEIQRRTELAFSLKPLT